jgi:hypothetical protein
MALPIDIVQDADWNQIPMEIQNMVTKSTEVLGALYDEDA